MSATKLINDDKLMVHEHFVAGQPHAEWKILREQCPVYWSEPKGFRPYWAVTKYKDLVEVESQPDIFINGPRFVIMPTDVARVVYPQLPPGWKSYNARGVTFVKGKATDLTMVLKPTP